MNGFIFGSRGFHSVETRGELRSDKIQKLFTEFHGTNEVLDACREEDGRFQRIIVYKYGGVYYPKRHSEDYECAPGCTVPHTRGHRSSDDHLLPTESIFLDRFNFGGESWEIDNGSGGVGSTTYRKFVGDLISQSLVNSWKQHLLVQRKRAGIPNIEAFVRGMADAIDGKKFADGRSAPEILNALGRKLIFGVIRSKAIHLPLPSTGFLELLCDSFSIAGERPWICRQRFCADRDLIASASASVQRGSHHTPPPYFFMAVAGPDKTLSRLAIVPVYFDGDCLVFVASGQERAEAHERRQRNEIFHKPYHFREFDLIAPLHPSFGWLANLPWYSTVDFARLTPAKRSLEEQRGFVSGVRPDYDAQLIRKAAHYTRPPFLGICKYREVDGTKHDSAIEVPINWSNESVSWRMACD